MSHYVYRNMQATEISKLQLISPHIYSLLRVYICGLAYSLIRRLHLADRIYSDIIHFIFIATRSFYDEKRLT